MEWVEAAGKTRLEALEKALSEIGLPEDKVKVEVVEENKRRFGLIGSNYVKIRVLFDSWDRAVYQTRAIIEEILHKMDLTCVIEGTERNGSLCFNIISPQSALIIGKRGQTIDALQYLVNRIANKRMGQRLRVVLDTENYREKHVANIQRLARRVADQVRATGQPVFLAPMSSHDRRIVHLALQDDRGVCTVSKGEGPLRKIMVSPRGFSEEED